MKTYNVRLYFSVYADYEEIEAENEEEAYEVAKRLAKAHTPNMCSDIDAYDVEELED